MEFSLLFLEEGHATSSIAFVRRNLRGHDRAARIRETCGGLHPVRSMPAYANPVCISRTPPALEDRVVKVQTTLVASPPNHHTGVDSRDVSEFADNGRRVATVAGL